MRTGPWAASLLFFATACGTQTPPAETGPPKAEKPPPAPAATGKVVVHVQDMTKVLKLG
jgi:hypothetical protein